jgi:carbonic anhydrase/acetyltransferase-like protein (isoleucine patch superfamily)
MNATILNDSKIGDDSIVGAGSVVTEGKEFPDKSLILGVPGRVVRQLTSDEINKIKLNALNYVELMKDY